MLITSESKCLPAKVSGTDAPGSACSQCVATGQDCTFAPSRKRGRASVNSSGSS